jgi:hypothetical protein
VFVWRRRSYSAWRWSGRVGLWRRSADSGGGGLMVASLTRIGLAASTLTMRETVTAEMARNRAAQPARPRSVDSRRRTAASHGSVARQRRTAASHGSVARQRRAAASHGSVARQRRTAASHGSVARQRRAAASRGSVGRRGPHFVWPAGQARKLVPLAADPFVRTAFHSHGERRA